MPTSRAEALQTCRPGLPNTPDAVQTPTAEAAIRICRQLLGEGALLAIVDPKASDRPIATDLSAQCGIGDGNWHHVADVNQSAGGTDALMPLDEWPQFTALDWVDLAAE